MFPDCSLEAALNIVGDFALSLAKKKMCIIIKKKIKIVFNIIQILFPKKNYWKNISLSLQQHFFMLRQHFAGKILIE